MTDNGRCYSVTLKAPNATRPTVNTYLSLFDVYVGPKRTINRRRPGFADTLMVPEPATWTLETLRMVLHELTAFLPDKYADCAIAEIRADRPRGGQIWMAVWCAVSDTHRIEVGFDVEARELSVPMVDAIARLPKGPLQLSAIESPEAQGESEMPRSEPTAEGLRHLRRIQDTLKEIAYLDPAMLRHLDTLLNPIRERLGLDDDE